MVDVLSLIKRRVFLGKNLNLFFIINLFLGLLIGVLLFIKFRKFWLILFFSFIIFYVKYKRRMHNIGLTLEPILLLSVLILDIYGLREAIIVATVPLLAADIVSARFGLDTFISVFCKVLVLVSISVFIGYDLFLVAILSYVVFNEVLGSVISFKSGAPIQSILVQLLTSTLIRIVYFSIFFRVLMLIL